MSGPVQKRRFCRRNGGGRGGGGRTCVVTPPCAAAASPAPSSQPAPPSESLVARAFKFQQAFWKFLRPHTIRGTILGSTAVTLRALSENPSAIDITLVPRALLGVLALLCGNGYIVGINQIYDVSIDKVNKPFLPIASGELSPVAAWVLCGVLAVAGLAITAANFGPLISSLYAFGLFLGTAYSVPPLYLKRFPVLAFMIIATVRGFLLNFGVYYAARAALQLPFAWSPAVLFITSFVSVFAVVIAITKDMPDIEGDKKFGVETFATRAGPAKLSYVAAGLLITNYAAAVVLPLVLPGAFPRPWLVIAAHSVLAALVVRATLRLRAAEYSQEAIKAYYRFIWSIFYSEYAIFPFM